MGIRDVAGPPIICTICKEIKPRTEFYTRSNGRQIYSWCKKCKNKKQYEWQKRSGKKTKYSRSKYARNRAQEHYQRVYEMLGNKCARCGQQFDECVYDIHHIDPSKKEYNIANIIRLSFKLVEEEIKKCILLCANCHRILHKETRDTLYKQP